MKIVLAETHSGSSLPEKSFNLPIVRVGRDAADCQIVFDNGQFPMVSRRHAELRWLNGKWMLCDLNSSYGTFLDGQKVSAPQAVQIGSRLQFGANGPTLNVVWFEMTADAPPTPAPQIYQSQTPTAPSPPNSVHTQQTPDAQLEFADTAQFPKPFKINKDSVWLGREPQGDVVFDANAVMVSRKHAEIRRTNGNLVIHDNGSFNGTLVNDQRISAPTPLYHDDEIQLGIGGPILRFVSLSRLAPKGASLAGQRSIAIGQLANLPEAVEHIGSKTMVFKADSFSSNKPSKESAQPQLLMSLAFGGKNELIIGRSESSDIKLDGLQISNRHARLLRSNAGVAIEDAGSTNGIYINGNRISRQIITPGDAAQIGSFLIQIDESDNIGVFDTRSKTRIDAVGITKNVKSRTGGGQIRLLDDVSLSIQPNEFVG
ncbi:MAG: FHA domain-containing protein, partial [Pyrinomonadaceae bacterium]|nr:FHA domain-containing protein [Pyrinomonadaceae bacterium]